MNKRPASSDARSSGAADPGKALARLWRVAPTATARGPRQGLDLDRIVASAVQLADDEGIEAVSMRRLADRLGVVPMTLYTYVPDKAELLELMVDGVYAAMERARPRDGSWQARLRAVLDDNRALFRQHPWLSDVPVHRPPLGPGVIAKYDYELAALEPTGLGDVALDAALAWALGFVASAARAAADKRAVERESRMSDRDWWQANEALLAQMFDAARFPMATRVGAAAGEKHGAAYDPDFMYAFGVERVVDGIAALIARR